MYASILNVCQYLTEFGTIQTRHKQRDVFNTTYHFTPYFIHIAPANY